MEEAATGPSPIILDYFGRKPNIDSGAFIAPQVSIIGDVTIGRGSSVWFGCVLRGDLEPITVGENSNIQDGTIIHTSRTRSPAVIGSGVTVGHRSVLHSCTLKDDSFIGMNATILDGAVIETNGMVAAGALVPPGKVVPSGELWAGVPAKKIRILTDEEIEGFGVTAENYRIHGEEYLGICYGR